MRTLTKPCLIWEGGKTNGYGVTYERGVGEYVHRLAYERINGPIPEGMMVCHTCDNRACYEPTHLFLGTHEQNQADKVAKGRQMKGEDCHLSKLNEETVLKIYNDPRGVCAIARELGLSHGTVGAIKRRETWKHLTQPA